VHNLYDNLPNDSPTRKFLNPIVQASYYANQISHIEYIPSRQAQYHHNNLIFHSSLQHNLKYFLGIDNLFSHQAIAIQAIQNHHHVVVSTATSSGKSLIYNLPVIDNMLCDNNITALYLFPTKVLTI
jgi:DEAD/DEAH box helicase domain-containing protein